MPFEPGKSGNPSGRPRVIREALEAFRNPEHLTKLRDRLLELAAGEDGKVACMAIKEWHDRAYGKPPQAITGEDGEPIKVDLTAIAGSLKKLAGE